MEKTADVYCRFCAESKSTEKTFNYTEEEEKYNEIIKKLAFLNAIYVDISDLDSLLPQTMCFVCYNSLDKAFEFLNKVKIAQDLLTSIYNQKYDTDDERVAYDEFSPAEDETPEVKSEETPASLINLQTGEITILNVKHEPKEEVLDQNTLSENSLNVQEIFDTALCDQGESSLTIYTKELTDISKKVVTNWSEYPWVCSVCDIEFLDICMLRSHCKMVHKTCQAFICVDCKFCSSKDFNAFLNHVRIHRKSLRYCCPYCNIKLDKNFEMEEHIQVHFQTNQVPCASCGEIQDHDDALQQHNSEYNSEKPKRKPRRKRGVPITIEDLTCSICKKVYKNPNSLRDHMKLHKKDRQRNYTCERCGKMFFNKGTLTSHIMSHDRVRPHICKICNRSFLFPNMLRRHVQMHTGVKPFSCDQCGRCFRLQYQLNCHKIIHTDAMPFVCQYCNKAFRFKQILKNHERQHTGAKPYSCQRCGLEFTNWSNYNKHMKRRHDTDTSKKKITPDGVFPVNPQTGQIIQLPDSEATEEWKMKIMIPSKRGKKKVVKPVS